MLHGAATSEQHELQPNIVPQMIAPKAFTSNTNDAGFYLDFQF
jgi:hypothetical protein